MAEPVHPNWSRWITASLYKHFNDRRQDVPFFVEGQIRPSTVGEFAEYRMDGPYFNEINSHYWYVDVLPAILVQIIQDTNIYKLERFTGIFASAFETDISVRKYGDGNGELGCLSLVPGTHIRVDKFGQIQAATRIAQASIEARYQMKLKT
jgi:hypothetical protein